MKITKTKFKDLVIIKKNTYYDKRGYLREIFKENILKKKFKFEILSYSKKNVLRGLHLQKKNPQGKFITVLEGKVFDVALDLRKKSKTFGKHFSIILSSKQNISIYIPPGFAHGFCALKGNTIMHYKFTNYRDAKSEMGILWNDKNLKIKWPIKKPIVSGKDKNNYDFKSFLNKW